MGIFTKQAQSPDDRSVYGHKFQWTPAHKTPEDLRPLIYTYDKIASDAVDRLDELVPPATSVRPRQDIQDSFENKEKTAPRDVYKLALKHADDEIVSRLWAEVRDVPAWVDWAQIERGQRVFWRYGGAGVTALTYLSLLGGMGSGRTVETLDRTGGFDAKVVRRRLLETTQHTLGVHKDLEAIKPGGDAFESSIRVRLLHASVRRRIMHLARDKPEYFDVGEHGVPISDLDCIGTINTFSASLIWLGWPRQGIFLRRQEVLDFLALWRYVAYLMGTPHDWLATPDGAKAMMESLLLSEIKPTPKSSILARNIITGLEGHPPTYASRDFQSAVTYWLNGSELSMELGIERPPVWYSVLVAGQCALFVLTAYITRSFKSWDEWHIKATRTAMYGLLVTNKSKGALGYKATFSFKWVPNLVNITTPLGEPDPAARGKTGLRMPGVERSALIILTWLTVAVAFGAWGIGKIAHALWTYRVV